MREIKFRMWHIKDKKYYEIYSIGFCGRGLKVQYVVKNYQGIPEVATLYELESPFEEYETPYETPFVLEQFTGLHDKNKVEIWEGDKLRYNTGFSGEPKVREGIVVFKVGSFGVDNASMALSWYANEYGCEVIGNVHEVKKC